MFISTRHYTKHQRVVLFKPNNILNQVEGRVQWVVHCDWAKEAISLNCTTLDWIILHCTALHCTELNCFALNFTALHIIALCCTVHKETVLHFTSLPPHPTLLCFTTFNCTVLSYGKPNYFLHSSTQSAPCVNCELVTVGSWLYLMASVWTE